MSENLILIAVSMLLGFSLGYIYTSLKLAGEDLETEKKLFDTIDKYHETLADLEELKRKRPQVD